MQFPFIGSKAVQSGHLTRSQLRRRYRPIYRGIYVPARHDVSLRDRIVGASLATGGVIAGVAASAVHGASWVDPDIAIEVIPSTRPLPRLRAVLPLIDGGAESPRETWLRLLFVDNGLPSLTTQFVICEHGRYVRRVDMVWEEFKVGAEYDGAQYARDVWADRALKRLDWHIVHVIKEDDPVEVVREVRTALLARGWRP